MRPSTVTVLANSIAFTRSQFHRYTNPIHLLAAANVRVRDIEVVVEAGR